MIRRTKIQIIKETLIILSKRLNSGISKTKFLQLSGLSPQAFKQYYNLLKKSKLIKENYYHKKHKLTKNKSTRPLTTIFLTPSGEDYLERFRLLLSKMNKLNEDYNVNLDEITN